MNKKKKSPTEDRDQQFLRRMSNVEHKVDSIEQTLAFSLRANEQQHFESVKKVFGRSVRRVQIYLAANGNRSVQDIAKLLQLKPSNVSTALNELQREGVLEVIERDSGKKYWGKKSIDRTLRISRFLMKEHNLDKNGIPVK